MNTEKDSVTIYTILGVIFGCLFPVFATLFHVSWQGIEISYDSVLQAQKSEPLLWIIDTAPIFLGLVASMAGINKSQEKKLRIISQKVEERKNRLELHGQRLREISQYAEVVNVNIEGAFPRLTQTIAEIVNVDRVAIWLAEDKASSYSCSVLCNYSDSDGAGCENYPNITEQNIIESIQLLKQRKFLQSVHSISENKLSDFAPYLGLNTNPSDHNINIFPVLTEGQVVGLICCGFSDTNRMLEEDEVNFIDSIGNLVALLLCAKERDVAESADRAKSEFLAVISHELRTPLNIISGYNDMILRKESDLNAHYEFAKEIRASSQMLEVIIDDVLDMAKIEIGVLELDKTQFNIPKIIEMATRLANKSAIEKKIAFECYISNDVPSNLIGDDVRVRQIIYNLAGNAVKFTEEGGVKINVTKIEDDRGRFVLRFDVIDTGIGIEEGKKSLIFDPFTQGNGSLSRNHGGTGLGLGLCKKLSELMDGKIGVNSVIGEGSHFWVEIPFEVGNF